MFDYRARLCANPAHLGAAAKEGESGGWIGTTELAELRACSPEKINVDVHRLRKLFEEAGIHDAARIVERDDTKKLRISIDR